jgi:hypothetical protein
MLTPRQRVENVLRGEAVDHVPLTMYQSMIPQCAVERQLRNDGVAMIGGGPVMKAHQPNVKIQTHTYTEDGAEFLRRTYTTPVGEVYTLHKQSADTSGFTSWTVSKMFKGPEDYKVLRFMAEDTTYEPDYDAFRAADAWMGEDFVMRGGIALTPIHQIITHFMGVETFAFEWADRRDEIDKLNKVMMAERRQIYPIVAASPVTHANYGGNETADVVGRERFEQYVLPCWNEAAEVFHKHGTLIGSHLDGNNKPWADLVADSPLDYIEAFTPAPDSDMTLKEALDTWPNKILWINFTSSAHLKDVAGIEEVTRDLLRQAAPGNRLIVGITEDIPADRWQQNMLAINRVVCDEGRLPIEA